jgi:glycosyltransferase involved in cell wall biosynthesis
MATLVVSPESYPYDVAKEQSFLEPELPYLRQAFDRVIVVPQQMGGQRVPLPDGIELDESYAREVRALSTRRQLVYAARSGLIARELLSRRRELMAPAALRRLVAFAGRAWHAAEWVRRSAPDATCYTFWWGPTSLGFALAGRPTFTRAHGFDLYEERHAPPYLPCRAVSLRRLRGVFPDSDKGRDYLLHRYGARAAQVETARLGLTDPKVTCQPSGDGALHVVSCSLLVPVKRLDRLIDGLAAISADQRVVWTHFGTGELQAPLEAQAKARLGANVSWRFAGYSTQSELFAWYASNPVDAFVNVSASEGTPVAIIEAVACGIPVLATAIGGNPEIATAANGLNLAADPTPADIAAALMRFRPSAQSGEWRTGSRRVWAEKYDAQRNYGRFAYTLRQQQV